MTEGAFVSRLCLGSWSFRFGMIEIEVSPPSRSRKSLGILNGHISTVVGAGEISSPRRFRLRAVGILGGTQSELQLLKHDCAVGGLIRFLGYLVCPRVDVDLVIFRGTRLPPIQPA